MGAGSGLREPSERERPSTSSFSLQWAFYKRDARPPCVWSACPGASPGHYPTTRWPGDPGTVGVAAHNVYWINFPQLAKGDEIDLETRYGLYRYRLVSTEIVSPNDRTALVTDVNGYHLTLTTCWPLWAGAFATQRYIIHADQVWPVPIRPGYT